jgi:lipopolysaccharide export system protein LptC
MTDLAAHDPVRATRPAGRRREEVRARRHTRLVRRLRILMPVTGLLIVAGLMAAAVAPKLLPLSQLAGLSLTADGLVMHTPRLSGHLGEGRRYEVVAGRAVQSLLDPSRLSLEDLDARLEMGGGERVTIHGNRAAYDTDTEVLELTGGVRLDSTDGSAVRLPGAMVDLRKGRLEGAGGIEITSPRGHIRAGRIAVTDGGAVIRLTGGVSITVHPET